jgi:hypothetical protein
MANLPTKFLRQYQIEIQVKENDPNFIVVTNPITIEFETVHACCGSANTGRFILYNLKPDTRHSIYQDEYTDSIYRQVIFKAGYVGQHMSVMFKGNMRVAYSQRVNTDWHTIIDCFDGGYSMFNGDFSESIPDGANKKTVLTKIFSSMPSLGTPIISDYKDTYPKGFTAAGKSWDVIQNILDFNIEHAFIEHEIPYCLFLNDYVKGDIPLIDASTGLLATPIRKRTVLDIRTLFEPRIRLGQVVELQSLETEYDGQYKVVGYGHSGMISDAVCGELITNMQLFVGTANLKLVGSA